MSDDSGLPPTVELLWGLRERPRRGPKPALTLDRIVSTAITLADAEGLGPLSMSRLADELGFTTMSLYRYVKAKDDLLVLMVDTAGRMLLTPSFDPADGVRDGLVNWCQAYLGLLMRHPWILQIPISGPPIEPSSLTWMEQGLRLMAGTGLTGAEKVSVILLLSGYVRNYGRLATDLAANMQRGPGTPTYGQLLRIVIDADRFPELFAMVEDGVFDDEDDDFDEFDFGLQRILDGIEALFQSRRPAP